MASAEVTYGNKIMKMTFFMGLVFCAAGLAQTASALTADPRCFEMRVYYAAPGKLDELHARFRDHTMKLFAKHGIENIGYWTPIENPDNKLVYVIAYPSREVQKSLWGEFFSQQPLSHRYI